MPPNKQGFPTNLDSPLVTTSELLTIYHYDIQLSVGYDLIPINTADKKTWVFPDMFVPEF